MTPSACPPLSCCTASRSILPVASALRPSSSLIVVALRPLSALSAWVVCAFVPATCSTSAGRLRKAMLSPTESRIGKTNIQKTASGSREKRRKRVEVSWKREPSLNLLIAQVPPRERDKNVFQRRRVGAELGQVHSLYRE